MRCNQKTEVYSRIVGYFRPVQNWNIGKKREFDERVEFSELKAMTCNMPTDSVPCAKC